VDTLHVAGNAITIPISAYTAAAEYFVAAENIQSAAITSTGAPIAIIMNFVVEILGSGTYTLIVNIRRTSTDIYTATYTLPSGYHCISASMSETPGAGSHTYYLRTATDGEANGYNRSIILLETKK